MAWLFPIGNRKRAKLHLYDASTRYQTGDQGYFVAICGLRLGHHGWGWSELFPSGHEGDSLCKHCREVAGR